MTEQVLAPHGFRRLLCQNCGSFIDVPIHCSSKSCEICTGIRRWRIYRRIFYALEHLGNTPRNRWRHITLTVRNSWDLAERLDHLVKSFRNLRQRKIWKSTQDLGFYVIEITKGESGWHPHLHIISYGRYLPFRKLLSGWLSVTKDSHSIGIRTIKSGRNIARYVSKYITKPSSLLSSEIYHIDEVTKHRRLFGPFGAAHQLMITWKIPDKKRVCVSCGGTDFLPDFVVEIYSRAAIRDTS